MPYDVNGWVEATWIPPQEREGFPSLWMPVLSLGVFSLTGDDISNYLFGLSKLSAGPGLFGERGVPADCTDVVASSIASNHDFIAKYGEGNFGHTHASLQEIQAALAAPGAPEEADSGWHHALASVEFILSERACVHTPWCRFLVWANW